MSRQTACLARVTEVVVGEGDVWVLTLTGAWRRRYLRIGGVLLMKSAFGGYKRSECVSGGTSCMGRMGGLEAPGLGERNGPGEASFRPISHGIQGATCARYTAGLAGLMFDGNRIILDCS